MAAQARRELGVLALPVAAVLGAWCARPAPLLVPLAGMGLGLARRRPLLVVLAVGFAASALAARAWEGVAPVDRSSIAGVVVLRSDPVPRGRGVAVEVEHEGHRYEAWAFGRPARRLRARLAGEQVVVSGRVGPAPAQVRRRLATRHVVGRLDVETVGDSSDGRGMDRSVNRVRRLVADGARTLPSADRALYLGLVLGDDRDLPEPARLHFRDAGLSHLTAVSGDNRP